MKILHFPEESCRNGGFLLLEYFIILILSLYHQKNSTIGLPLPLCGQHNKPEFFPVLIEINFFLILN
jgi:hypothetical protein